ARTAGEAVLHHPGDVAGDGFLATLAESLVVSGMAMVVAGTSQPCSGACHEVSHAIDLLLPERAGLHGEQVGLGAALASWLRGDLEEFAAITAALVRHGLPVLPAQLGLDDEEFVRVLAYAPMTRPGRYTVLEHLALGERELRAAVADYCSAAAAYVLLVEPELGVAA
ncbi:iron-containing alcohol dehydrogenase family protein, partial [Motilibacter sp. E257]